MFNIIWGATLFQYSGTPYSLFTRNMAFGMSLESLFDEKSSFYVRNQSVEFPVFEIPLPHGHHTQIKYLKTIYMVIECSWFWDHRIPLVVQFSYREGGLQSLSPTRSTSWWDHWIWIIYGFWGAISDTYSKSKIFQDTRETADHLLNMITELSIELS